MKDLKHTRKALLASVATLTLSCAMLVGSTFAWFTDTAETGTNKIVAGNLEVDLLMADAAGVYDSIADEEAAIFGEGSIAQNNATETLWEPGKTQIVYLAVANEGNLDLKYNIQLNVKNGGLAGALEYAIIDGAKYGEDDVEITDWEDLIKVDGVQTGKVADIIAEGNSFTAAPNGAIKVGEDAVDYFALAVHMDEEAGNEYENTGITIDVTVVAGQLASEEDSFGNQYDAEADYGEVSAKSDKWDGTADTSWYNETDTEFEITTAAQLAGLAELVDGGNTFEGKTVKLGVNIDLASLPFNPIGHSANGKSFNGTFDGQGHTISNMYEQNDLGAWQYEGEYYGLFAYTNGATIKDVTIADAYISSGRNEAAGVVGYANNTTFSDITISDTTLIVYNNSAGGVAAECYGACSFTDIVVDEGTVVGPLWGTYDAVLGGVVGMVKTGNNVAFENITVACKIDSINDVASNYQYWLYRYSGMLIGKVDGVNGLADPSGYVTCENVKVIYDDWMNYHYCEFESLGAGSYNPPGEYKYARVEAGTGTDGIDVANCQHDTDESHNVLIVFDQLFGGGQGVKGLKAYDGVTVNYNNK